MKIYASTSLDPRLSELCERALMNDDFSTHEMVPGGDQIISFESDSVTYVAVLQIERTEGEGDALLISAVHPVGSEGLDAVIADLRSA